MPLYQESRTKRGLLWAGSVGITVKPLEVPKNCVINADGPVPAVYLMLQVRTRTLNNVLRSTFNRWYPGMKEAA
jgi:hypothetical protein